MQKYFKISTLMFAVVLTACGGGGGSSGTTQESYEITLRAEKTQLPLNTGGNSAGKGVYSPYTSILYVESRIGGKPIPKHFTKTKKGTTWQMTSLTFHQKTETVELNLETNKATWLLDILEKISLENITPMTYSQLKTDFETTMEDFELFWFSKQISSLRESGLLVL